MRNLFVDPEEELDSDLASEEQKSFTLSNDQELAEDEDFEEDED